MLITMKQFTIAAFYQFIQIENTENALNQIKLFCKEKKLRGTIIIATEGINGTISGLPLNIEAFLSYLNQIGFSNSNIKISKTRVMPFYRLKIKIKPEIITFLGKSINLSVPRGFSVKPENWDDFIKDENIILLDVRNKYETKLGSFVNAIDPQTNHFTEFKEFLTNNLENYEGKKIAMFCTGGIRCEKASLYLQQLGHKQVYQLDGGILKYLETVPEIESKWTGECFVFDNRVSVTHQLKRGQYELCNGCREPISQNDKLSVKYEEGVSCAYCFDSLKDKKAIGSRERSRQIKQHKLHGTISTFSDLTPEHYNRMNES
ncbi:MAG TPA: hypothetical protein DEZ08_00260 [Dehalococcoidia bacterium]|nr:hypothetical protein [Dehalococcoidia bacterium]